MQKRTPSVWLLTLLLAVVALAPSPSAQLPGFLGVPGLPSTLSKLDPLLQARVLLPGQSRVIVRASGAGALGPVTTLIQQLGGTTGSRLSIVNSQAAVVSNATLALLSASPLVERVSFDRLTVGAMERTGQTIGAAAVREALGLDGSGVGVAVIDSGVTSWHDDLGGHARVERFVDLIGARLTPYDDYGHGTHVAGIIAGNGFDSGGARSGIAPGARLTVLKVLDHSGRGRISDVIAALGYVVAHRDELNIRVVNLSVATGVHESYNSDPLTLAALEAVRAGIVVVAAAGNNGRSAQGRTQYGGITAPGNAPWVLTVGASSHMGTTSRADDTMAAFSSRGPGAVDHNAKPDLVAPGVGIESLSDPASAFYATKSRYLLNGTAPTSYLPYLSLSGTSMATPVVSGTVALMLQANPALTPNAVKAILQYTAQKYSGWDPLTQGTGFLNARGAIELSRYISDPSNHAYPASAAWNARIIWGNRLARGGRLTANASAWPADVTWGAETTPGGQRVELGVICSTADCDHSGSGDPWRVSPTARNVVWGTACGGADCGGTWYASGANDGDTVVWGTDDGDTVVWGTDDGDTVVWGTSCADASCEPEPWSDQ